MFLKVKSTDGLSWSLHTSIIVKAPTQCLFFLHRLRSFDKDSRVHVNSTHASLKISWLAASLPVRPAGMFQTIKLYREWSKHSSASGAIICWPCRTFTLSDVQEGAQHLKGNQWPTVLFTSSRKHFRSICMKSRFNDKQQNPTSPSLRLFIYLVFT